MKTLKKDYKISVNPVLNVFRLLSLLIRELMLDRDSIDLSRC